MLLRIFLACIVFFLVAQTGQYNQIKTRTTDTFIKASQGEYDNASGGRMIMFRTALEVSRHFPLGVGTDNFRSGATAVIILDAINNENIVVKNKRNVVLDNYNLKGDIHNYRLLSFNEDGTKRYSSIYRHAHNEWLNILAENGVAGIILLTLLFAFPIKIFWQNLSHENNLVGMYSYCGILLIMSFAIFGQTQSVFTSHAAVIFFIFFLFLFIAQISRLSNIDDNHDSAS